MKRYICLSILFCLVVCSCSKNKMYQEEFVSEMTEIGLTIKGETLFTYDPVTQQLGYTPSKNEFRAFDDYLSNYLIVSLSSDPASTGEITGNVVYTTSTEIVEKSSISFKMIKSEPSSGLYWLWSRKSGVGVVVRKL